MHLPRIHIIDSDQTAALVTKLGLEARLKSEADVGIVSDTHDIHRLAREPVDLLIVDPGAQSQAATALVRILQADYPETPLLVLTAYDSPRLRAQMRKLGVHSYLAKPVGVLDLETVVRTMMRRRKEAIVDTEPS
ncbi:MAG: response regulator transcription factor [Chloroflexaceae bacterium]|nr:response regulator transcription factor [Chloroflexaceae bacterium]NJL33031.1 response regulator transcription factor [Chloroflexaceae bacterium]NJO06852.1 response regulator transcription factor [Chloroflexaceae bacterium]